MQLNMAKEMAALERMTVGELQRKYAEICGETTASRHRAYLIRRIAWRTQAAEGGLSERALARAAELVDPAEARVTPPRARRASTTPPPLDPAPASLSDPRLPPVGSALTRVYRGRTVAATVLVNGFEFEGERYASLSALAKAITGSHINGFRFFGLEARR